MNSISVVQVKLWIGDLYVANKMLENEVEALKEENYDSKEEIESLKIKLSEFTEV